MAEPSTLLITKGHPFDKGAFFNLFDQLPGQYTHIEQPLAAEVLTARIAANYDCLVFYDMPGIEFALGGPKYSDPPDRFKSEFSNMLDQGTGMVFLHHAIAGWPNWQEYHKIIGGQFLYTARSSPNGQIMDSGYRHDINHEISVLDPSHPVANGVPQSFSMTDELYLYEVYEEDIEPLLASNFTFDQKHFYSAAAVVERGERFSNSGWSHAPGSALVGWTKQHGQSRICYLQGGDDPTAWANPHFIQLLSNAIQWVGAQSPTPEY